MLQLHQGGNTCKANVSDIIATRDVQVLQLRKGYNTSKASIGDIVTARNVQEPQLRQGRCGVTMFVTHEYLIRQSEVLRFCFCVTDVCDETSSRTMRKNKAANWFISRTMSQHNAR